MDVLNVTEKSVEDNSIYSLDYFPFNPIQGTQYNTPGIIQIDIQNQDEYFLPHKSWLQIDLVLKKNDGNRYADVDVSLTNNGLMYLFQNVKYLLGGNEIETLNYPGHATTMLGVLKYAKSYSGVGECWCLDNNKVIAANTGFDKRKAYILALATTNKGTTSFALDLEHFSGFSEDYDKVIFGMRQSLQFNRKGDSNDVIFRTDAAGEGKVEISKITWWMARVKPSVSEEIRLNKLNLTGKAGLDLWFRNRQCSTITVPDGTTNYTWNLGVKTERPKYVVIGFQTYPNIF